MNRVEAFRHTLVDGELVLLEERRPSFTDLKPGSETFHIVTLPAGDDLADFCRTARAVSRAQTTSLDPAQENRDLIFFTCLSWIELTAATNERDLDPDDAVPRVAWASTPTWVAAMSSTCPWS